MIYNGELKADNNREANMKILFSIFLLTLAMLASVRPAAAQELPASIIASPDAATMADQRLVYMLIHQYEQLLNAGNTEAIVELFTADAVIEWNNTPTFTTRQQEIDGYNAL